MPFVDDGFGRLIWHKPMPEWEKKYLRDTTPPQPKIAPSGVREYHWSKMSWADKEKLVIRSYYKGKISGKLRHRIFRIGLDDNIKDFLTNKKINSLIMKINKLPHYGFKRVEVYYTEGE